MQAAVTKLAQRIREEFEEAVGLRLSVNEATRFFGLDVETCVLVLTQLQERGFLAKDIDGRYWRA
jgi:2,4-dienoyl-CoA reductase-like NADH-dependent reductase (Old Yellow Enzyme family)